MTQGGRSKKQQQGFTMVEVLIVLGVTAMLFVTATIFISGKQNTTEFQVSSRDVKSKIQQIINETSAGYFPESASFGCKANGGATTPLNFTGGGGGQGTRNECVFAGKAIIFNRNKITTISLAGARKVSGGGDPTNPQEARVSAIPNITETYSIPNGVEIVSASYDNASLAPLSGADSFGLALVSNFANFATVNLASGETSGGAQEHSMYRINGLGSTTDADDYRPKINSMITGGYVQASKVNLCFRSGGTNQSTLISVGGAGGLGVVSEVKQGGSC